MRDGVASWETSPEYRSAFSKYINKARWDEPRGGFPSSPEFANARFQFRNRMNGEENDS